MLTLSIITALTLVPIPIKIKYTLNFLIALTEQINEYVCIINVSCWLEQGFPYFPSNDRRDSIYNNEQVQA